MDIMDSRRHAPATARNREPILAVLRDVLPATGLVLEIASGTGEHAVHFGAALPSLDWQPSDPDAASRKSIAAWVAEAGLANVRAPLALDASSAQWPIARADTILCINMIHISPWAATQGLMAGAERVLGPGGVLYLYGPYRRADMPTAPSNEAFDADLRRRNSEWGLRDLEDVVALADRHGFSLDRVVEMPVNNLSVVFRKDQAQAKP